MIEDERMDAAQQQQVYDQIIKAYDALCEVETVINKYNATERPLWDENWAISQRLLKAAESPLLEKAKKRPPRELS